MAKLNNDPTNEGAPARQNGFTRREAGIAFAGLTLSVGTFFAGRYSRPSGTPDQDVKLSAGSSKLVEESSKLNFSKLPRIAALASNLERTCGMGFGTADHTASNPARMVGSKLHRESIEDHLRRGFRTIDDALSKDYLRPLHDSFRLLKQQLRTLESELLKIAETNKSFGRDEPTPRSFNEAMAAVSESCKALHSSLTKYAICVNLYRTVACAELARSAATQLQAGKALSPDQQSTLRRASQNATPQALYIDGGRTVKGAPDLRHLGPDISAVEGFLGALAEGQNVGQTRLVAEAHRSESVRDQFFDALKREAPSVAAGQAPAEPWEKAFELTVKELQLKGGA